MNEIKACSVLIGADEEKVKGFLRGILEMALEKGVTIREFAAGMEALGRYCDGECGECKSVKEIYDTLFTLPVAAFDD